MGAKRAGQRGTSHRSAPFEIREPGRGRPRRRPGGPPATRSGSVQLAITSPPYNVGIAYAGYTDDRVHRDYLAWLKSVWADLLRVLVPGGRFALNVAPTSIKAFRPIHHELTADLRDLGYIMRTEVIWYKQTMGRRTAWGSWRSPSNPHIIPSWEYVLVFSKGQWKLPGRPEDVDITGPEFQAASDGFWAIPPERTRGAIRPRSPSS